MVNPKLAFYLNIVMVIATALTGIGWATVMDTQTAAIVVFILTTIATVVNSLLHGFSAPTAGPLVKGQ